MIIYGAGMAGLLAGHMLRRFEPVIREAQAGLPNNHEALLRFRTDAVAKAVGIPFRRVLVEKAIWYQGQFFRDPNLRLNNMYSGKVIGEYRPRSIGNLESVERYIAPPDFIAQMAKSCNIVYSSPFTANLLQSLVVPPGEDFRLTSPTNADGPVISTIPMPMMMDLLQWPNELRPTFEFNTIWSAWVQIDSPAIDLYQTIYYPDPNLPYYRASITGNRLIVEFLSKVDKIPNSLSNVTQYLNDILDCFGLRRCGNKSLVYQEPVIKEQKYGKLLPVSEDLRRRFVFGITEKYGLYSLGRFATWRQLLMDDVVKDVSVVERLITDRGALYNRRLQFGGA